MTDARIPGNWLGDPRFDSLSDLVWRVFTSALQWSNVHGTDGFIPTDYLRMLHPKGEQPDAFRVLEERQFWVRTDDGYRFLEWVKVLGQATAAQVEHSKAMHRARSQRYRDSEAKKLGKTGDVTRHAMGSGDASRRTETETETETETAFIEERSETENEVENSRTSDTPKLSLVRVPVAAPADAVKLATEMNADPGTGEIPESSGEYVHTDADAPAEWDGWPDDEKVTS